MSYHLILLNTISQRALENVVEIDKNVAQAIIDVVKSNRLRERKRYISFEWMDRFARAAENLKTWIESSDQMLSTQPLIDIHKKILSQQILFYKYEHSIDESIDEDLLKRLGIEVSKSENLEI